MSRKWSDESMMTFVKLYQHEPILWDPSNDDYRNKKARNAALERIVKGVNVDGFTVKECKIKIKNLRSHYWQEIAKIQRSSSSGSGTPYKPTVAWFKTVDSFLRHFVLQNSSGNLDKKLFKCFEQEVASDDSLEKDEIDPEVDERTERKSTVPDRTCLEKDAEFVVDDSSHKLSSRYNLGSKRRTSEATQRVPEEVCHLKKVRSEKESEFDLWAKSVAKQLNDMEPRRALALQLKLQSLLTEERIAYYDVARGGTPSGSHISGQQQLNELI